MPHAPEAPEGLFADASPLKVHVKGCTKGAAPEAVASARDSTLKRS